VRAALIIAASLVVASCGESAPSVSSSTPAPPPTLAAEPAAIDVARVLVRGVGDLQGVRPDVVDAARGFGGVVRRELDGLIALRAPTEAEQRDAAGRDIVPDEPLVTTVLARDAIALVVPDGGDVYAVTRAELAGALQGDGRPLGLPQGFAVFGPPPESSVWPVLRRELSLPDDLPFVQVAGTSAEVVRRVREHGAALGVASRTAVVGVRPLGISEDGATRSLSDDWPLHRELLLVTRGAPTRFAALVEFAGSPAGLMTFQREGFVAP